MFQSRKASSDYFPWTEIFSNHGTGRAVEVISLWRLFAVWLPIVHLYPTSLNKAILLNVNLDEQASIKATFKH